MSKADLYLNKVDLCNYWPKNATIQCQDFLAQLKVGEYHAADYPFLSLKQVKAFKLVLEAESYLPLVPQLTVPQPMKAGLFPINKPDKNSLVIVSGNNQHTFEVLASVWAQGITPAYFLLVDCVGSTVDMAMIFKEFTPARLLQSLKNTALEEKVKHRRLIVPGFTSPLVLDFVAAIGWEIEVGPVCAIELPLFLGERWIFPNIPT